jgi:hypothetical protein
MAHGIGEFNTRVTLMAVSLYLSSGAAQDQPLNEETGLAAQKMRARPSNTRGTAT